MIASRVAPQKLPLLHMFTIALFVSAGCLLGIYIFLRRQPVFPTVPPQSGIIQLRLVQTPADPPAPPAEPADAPREAADAVPQRLAQVLTADRRDRPDTSSAPAGGRHANFSPNALPVAPTGSSLELPSSETILNFQRVLFTHIERYRRYPVAALGKHLHGSVLVLFSMRRDGAVQEISVESSSGSPVLDLEAVDTVRRAQPLPSIPPALSEHLKVLLPVEFEASP